MKKKNHFGKRMLSLLLCLVMVVCMLPTAAFAAESEPAGPDNSGTDVIGSENVNDAGAADDDEDATVEPTPNIGVEEGKNLIPEDAEVKTTSSVSGNTATTTTDTTWEKHDKDLMDAANAELEENGANQYGEKKLITDEDEAAIVDQLKGDDNEDDNEDGNTVPDLDSIPDGTYSKKEEQTKQDVTDVIVKGEQHETSSSTVYPDGRPASDSYSVEGEQSTTVETTTTTKTTTTEVEKETGKKDGETWVDETADPEVITTGAPEDKGILNPDEEKKDADPIEGEKDEVEVTLSGNVLEATGDKAEELTVSEGSKKAEDTVILTTRNDAAVKKDLLTALTGWTVTASDGTEVVIEGVNADGSVVCKTADGQDANVQVNVVNDGNGNYSITATKFKKVVTTGSVNWDPNPNKGNPNSVYANDVDENGNPIIMWNTDGVDENGNPVTKWEEYKLAETTKNEDGSITKKYYKKTGTADRTDTYEWIEETTRTDGVREITQSVTAEAHLTNGEYTVTAVWGGVRDTATNTSGGTITVLGPSQQVIQFAINGRNNNDLSHHIILTNRAGLADKTAAELAGGFGSTDSGNLHLDKIDDVDGLFIQSTIRINNTDGVAMGGILSTPWLRRMGTEGNYFYVYCAEHGKATSTTPKYDIVDVDEHGVYSENANHIQYAVENGWWGTEEGKVGSLGAVQAFARSYMTEKGITTITVNGKAVTVDVSKIDEGIAMAATQAAIWRYTSSKSNKNNQVADENVFTQAWTDSAGSGSTALSEDQQAAAMALYKALTRTDWTDDKAMADKVNATDFIEAENIKEASIQVVEKVDAKSVEELTDAVKKSLEGSKYDGKAAEWTDNDEDLYKTTVSVTLAIVPSRLGSGDLMVYVYSGDKIVGSKRINQAELEKDNGKVTIENVVLKSGDGTENNVKFHLEGTQYLQSGAYLFSTAVDTTKGNTEKTQSQTMVGYVNEDVGAQAKKHNVNLEVSMSFKVDYTAANATGSADGDISVKAYNEIHGLSRDMSSTQKVKENHEQTVTVTTTVSSNEAEKAATTETNVTEALFWADSASHNYTYDPAPSETPNNPNTPENDDDVDVPEPETPLNETPNENEDVEVPDVEIPLAEMPDEEIEIPDEEIPLADVPQTGDMSAQWCVMTAMAAAGLMVLVMIERKKREEG